MSNHERSAQNRETGSSGRGWNTHDDRPNTDDARRGDVARKSVKSLRPRHGPTKAARKTFALPQSDLGSAEDDDEYSSSDNSTRMHRPDPRTDGPPAFASKSGQTILSMSLGGNLNQPTSKAARRVTFTPDTQAHSSASGFGGRSIPVKGIFGPSPATLSQTRSPFLSKSTSQASFRRDPFSGGTPSRTTGSIRLAQPYSVSTPRPAYGSGMSVPSFPAHSTYPLSSSSHFLGTPAGESISSAGRRAFSKGRHQVTPPSKSRPQPPLEAVEDATWRKGFSPRKFSATHSGINPAPRMIASSMSASRRNTMRASVTDQVRPEDVGPIVFLGRNMTIYENNVAIESNVEEITPEVAKQGVTNRAKATSRTMPVMQVRRKVGIQGRISPVVSSSDSSEESSEESSESSEDEEMDSNADQPNTESEGEAVERPASPSNNLIAALEVLTLPSLRMQKTGQLPFLLRNLRRGFADRCHRLSLPTKPSTHLKEPLEVQLTFRLQTSEMVFADSEDHSDEYKTRMSSWNCPLCDLHGTFGTQAMLQKHIEWDHSEIKTRWTHDNVKSMWAIELYIPEPKMDREITVPIHNEIQRGPRSLPASALVPPPVASPVPIVLPLPESPVHSKLKNQPSSPPRSVSRFTSQTLSGSRSRSVTLTSSRAQTREPSSQPPLGDPLGPSAQYPYVPENPGDGQLYFSCRPGGPRIYDLLNTLPLAPFGVLSWFIVDREEELFELDDVLDEDKVMQALWGRWILLNHRKFLANYCRGTEAFIDEYWRMIHRAAGWAALRAWLLMFVVNRFLTGSEVAHILRHYEGLTEMDSWYTNEES